MGGWAGDGLVSKTDAKIALMAALAAFQGTPFVCSRSIVSGC